MLILGGFESQMFVYFKKLLFQCFVAMRKHMDYICDMIDLMRRHSKFECFKFFKMNEFKERFGFSLSDEEVSRIPQKFGLENFFDSFFRGELRWIRWLTPATTQVEHSFMTTIKTLRMGSSTNSVLVILPSSCLVVALSS